MSPARIENLTNIICPPFPQAIGHHLHEVDKARALLVTRGVKQYHFVSKKSARALGLCSIRSEGFLSRCIPNRSTCDIFRGRASDNNMASNDSRPDGGIVVQGE